MMQTRRWHDAQADVQQTFPRRLHSSARIHLLLSNRHPNIVLATFPQQPCLTLSVAVAERVGAGDKESVGLEEDAGDAGQSVELKFRAPRHGKHDLVLYIVSGPHTCLFAACSRRCSSDGFCQEGLFRF